MKIVKQLLLIVFLLCQTNLVFGESLWDDKAASFFADNKAHSIGDSITIVIEESSTAYQKAGTVLDNKSNSSIGPLASNLPGISKFTQFLSTATKLNEADKFDGKGTTQRAGQLSAKVTVKITKILDNGEYEIEGNKEVFINSENQKIRIKGTVRPKDIDENNTVLSTYVSNAQISYSGTGPVGDSQEPGILSKVLAFLF
ncbi:MAG TPA: flagellar biosynthesis protein FlgH [Candidatus Margulisbacteria bacterium]|nr:MAG: hypothetical protein A2X43_07605 [Candidatus Margulisbacteria bacterium GWD2_39_127]OGI03912.1 MAG: hypothetical protein A2X42_10130 [Candidatus Margulisbacteria bacterium GWF2_38_17]HAR61955.1 flagellar biosynthesis protein FlgH [Candidatus Margulisiibacteriota bacterium]